ncbi:MAG: septal ring lytic transglycosylase RlpA family protein [gamma proteobacterium symbiont of Taylorina sp.]|nr:septal ring lytic transglycosylase RlpA family protein [gamma proteobacterium symbiont of Taylorina sp.]
MLSRLVKFFSDFLFISALSVLLFSCSGDIPRVSRQDGPPAEQVNVDVIVDAVPQVTTRSKYGNPSSYVVFGERYHVMPSSKGYKERGIASWYGSKFHGRRTSSGEPYDMHAMTAAHKTLPLPTYVKVTNLKNNRQVILKVNDRGPFHEGRIIDLSHTAAIKLGVKGTGTGWVEVEAIDTNSVISPSKMTTRTVSKISEVSGSQSPVPVTLQNKADLYLQIGAFINVKNAYNLRDRLSSAIVAGKVHVSERLINEQKIYRVRIGPVTSTEQAEKLSKTLADKGFQKSQIIIEKRSY